ncbi:oxidoreductase [Legionella pneumophila]|uniref:oxidoreductase n=1 Tax=Legionella pneumophila TaxID=446 RepID=UPI0005C43083|nr:oxidoreductase [Legionella pneumophila]GAN31430.1 3-oxoacyl-[acyl-carrier-protein] reductase FabG [Legionella pneumophila]
MLEGKKILVAGAGGLLGSQVVKTLLEQNATVIASDNNYEGMQKRLIERDVDTKTQRLLLEQLNLNDEQQVIAFFERMDILDGSVNCSYPRNKAYGKHFFDVKLTDFNDNVSLHLGSSFLFMQQCAVLFLKNRKPFSLVNIASIYGVIAPDFDIYKDTPMTMPVEYAAIKSGLIHLSKYVTKYISDSNFRVNTVSPGGIYDNQQQAFLNAYQQKSFGKGMLNVHDVTGSILFLLSEHSRYVNGQNLIVDDGFSL